MNDRDDVSVNDEFVHQAKDLFDASVDKLDGATRSRLNRGRQAALQQIAPETRGWQQWVPAGGIATAAVAAFVVWSWTGTVEKPLVPEMASDIEILLDEDSLEMIEELEFYSWIDFDGDVDAADGPANNVG